MPVYQFKGSKPGRPKFSSLQTPDINGVVRIVALDATIELSPEQFGHLDEYAILAETDGSVVTAVEADVQPSTTAAVSLLPAGVLPQEGDVIKFTNGRWDVAQP